MDDTSKQEILDAINTSATETQQQLDALKTDVVGLKTDVSSLKTDVSSLKTDVSSLKTDVAYIKATMVTKDYLDEKLGDLRGDLVLLTRKEDKKVVAIIELLVERNVIAAADAKRILAMDPFPQFSVSSH